MLKDGRKSPSRDARSVPGKHLEIVLIADRMYLVNFQKTEEATEALITLAHMVREHSGLYLFYISNFISYKFCFLIYQSYLTKRRYVHVLLSYSFTAKFWTFVGIISHFYGL